LLRRVFAIDVLACPDCGGRLRLLATIEDRAVVEHQEIEDGDGKVSMSCGRHGSALLRPWFSAAIATPPVEGMNDAHVDRCSSREELAKRHRERRRHTRCSFLIP
jgi:hypothetical protein